MSAWFTRYGFAPVHPSLWVGAVPLDANDVAELAATGIDRVLNLVEDAEYPPEARLEVEIALEVNAMLERRVRIVDFGGLDAEALERAVAQVSGWLEQGHGVYLHCRAGWQRSATVAAGVIAIREGVDVETALARLATRKPTADPLPHQRDDLRRWWQGHQGETTPVPDAGE